MGYILLEGGAEFGGRMAEPDRQAIELAGGLNAPIRIIPAAAAPDNNHVRAGENGRRWFASLGAKDVAAVPLIDQRTANQPEIVAELHRARLVYMLGGFPGHLATSLIGSASWQAILEVLDSGGVFGGSSAGAMILCEYLYDPYQGRIMPGLGLLPNSVILPHHNTFGANWAGQIGKILPDAALIGIDERTGMINDGAGGAWRAYGQGIVTIYQGKDRRTYSGGQEFPLFDSLSG